MSNSQTGSQLTAQYTKISFDSAWVLLEQTQKKAKADGLSVAACVVDATGRTIAKIVMDGAPLIADELIERKARSALLGLSSQQFGEILSDNVAVRDSMMGLGELTLLGGGLPIMHDGQMLGAYAVGGALVDQDVALAESVLEAFLSNF